MDFVVPALNWIWQTTRQKNLGALRTPDHQYLFLEVPSKFITFFLGGSFIYRYTLTYLKSTYLDELSTNFSQKRLGNSPSPPNSPNRGDTLPGTPNSPWCWRTFPWICVCPRKDFCIATVHVPDMFKFGGYDLWTQFRKKKQQLTPSLPKLTTSNLKIGRAPKGMDPHAFRKSCVFSYFSMGKAMEETVQVKSLNSKTLRLGDKF